MVYSYIICGKFQLVYQRRVNYFPYVLMLPSWHWGNILHFDSQCFDGHIERRRRYLIPAVCQVNGEVVLDRQFYSPVTTLDPHICTVCSSLGWDEELGDEEEYLLYLWSASQQGLNRECVDSKGVWWEKESFLEYMNKSFSGAMICISNETCCRDNSGCWLIFLAWSGQSCSSHLMYPPVYLTVQKHSPNCNIWLIN